MAKLSPLSIKDSADLDMLHFKRTMGKIASFAYNWVDGSEEAARKVVKKPDGLNVDSHFSLTDLLKEAQSSNRITNREANVLGKNIPCCKKDKSKRHFIEGLMEKNNVNRSRIGKIEKDIKFDDEMAPSQAAKARDIASFRVNPN